MKSILAITFLTLACASPLPVADDTDPEVCSGENYPFEEAPDLCENNSYGTCCSWHIDSADGGTCRYDYCTYHETRCKWELMLEDCS